MKFQFSFDFLVWVSFCLLSFSLHLFQSELYNTEALNIVYHKSSEKRLNPGLLFLLLYIVLTIGILIGQEPPAFFENSRDFVGKHDYSIICYPILLFNKL